VATATALDAAAAAAEAAQPSAAAHAAAIAAAKAAATAEAARAMRSAAHVDDMDALDAALRTARAEAAAAVAQVREEDVRAVADFAHEEARQTGAKLARLTAEIEALREAVRAAVLRPAAAAEAAVNAEAARQRQRVTAPLVGAGPSVSAWRMRVLRGAGYGGMAQLPLRRTGAAGAATADAEAPFAPLSRAPAPSTRGVRPLFDDDS
jgi:hypothetical protein